MKRAFLGLVAGAAVVIAAGCSGSPRQEAAPGEAAMPETGVALEIRNDFNTTVDCLIEAPGRPRRILGTVLSMSSETYIVDTAQIVAGFRVLCTRQTGESVRSDPIDTIARAKITYTLSTGLINVQSLP